MSESMSTPDLRSLMTENALLREQNEQLHAVIAHCPAVIFVKTTDGRLQLCNRAYETLVGVGPGALLGQTDHEIFGPEAGEQNRQNDLRVCERGVAEEVEELIPQSDGLHTYISYKFPVYDRSGALRGVAGIATDITERRKAEQERNALQQQIIDVQRSVLAELSSPIMPIADGVIAMPLIGSIDRDRATSIMQSLLEGITHHRAHTAILDITGVRTVDSHNAAALLQSVRAARLLGTRVMFTGIRPEVAQTLLALGSEWSGIECLATLRDGVAVALRHGRKH